MAVILGLAVAAAYGSADFLGGLAARRSPLAAVVVGSQVVGLVVIAAIAWRDVEAMGGTALALSAVAGAVGGAALASLYRGLARGRMNVVAPITAVGAATVPVLWGLFQGERPSQIALTGVGLAIVAVVLVSRIPGDEAAAAGGRQAIVLAVLAGAGFGVVFVLLAETSETADFGPLVVMRVTSVLLLGTGAIVARRLRVPHPRAAAVIAVTGILDIAANTLYVLATREGLVSLVSVVSSLYPAITVLLARTVLGERLGRMQAGGLVLAGAGVVLIATG